MVSSRSTITGLSIPGSSGLCSCSPSSSRVATASSWRTWPEVNARRNDPSVDGRTGGRRPYRSPRGATGPCRRCCPRRRPCRPPGRSPLAPAWAPLSVGTLSPPGALWSLHLRNWPNQILEKSHFVTATAHFAVMTHYPPLPNRCIQAKDRQTPAHHGGLLSADPTMIGGYARLRLERAAP